MKTCNKCGSTIFYSSGRCKACQLEATKKWTDANKEKVKATALLYRNSNKDKSKEYNARRYVENAEKFKARNIAWAKENKEKTSAIGAKWFAANKDKVKAKNAAWVIKNQARSKERAAQYREMNPEKIKAATAKWRKANPDCKRISEQNRRAIKKNSQGRLTTGLSKKLFVLQKGKCPCCSNPLGSDYHMDHKMPLALGGSNTDDNMQLLRAICNMQKSALHPIDFMQSRGFLL